MHLGVRRERREALYRAAPWVSASRFRRESIGASANQCDAFHFGSLHIGGAHFLFADGSARLLPHSADPILPVLATRAGGETVATH
jgi:prepilin-type processing-associated H-X9-DG protein